MATQPEVINRAGFLRRAFCLSTNRITGRILNFRRGSTRVCSNKELNCLAPRCGFLSMVNPLAFLTLPAPLALGLFEQPVQSKAFHAKDRLVLCRATTQPWTRHAGISPFIACMVLTVRVDVLWTVLIVL